MPAVRQARRKAPGEYHHGDLRQAMLDAAVAIITESGAEAFTVREAARRVGVDHRAAYRHFEDKDAVLAAIAEDGYTRLVAATEAALAEIPPAFTKQRLFAIARAYVGFAYKEPARYRVMTGPRLNEDNRFPDLEKPIARAFALMEAEILRGVESGALRKVDLFEGALTLWSAMHGVASLIAMRRIRVRRPELDGFTERLIGCTIHGLES